MANRLKKRIAKIVSEGLISNGLFETDNTGAGVYVEAFGVDLVDISIHNQSMRASDLRETAKLFKKLADALDPPIAE